MRVGSGPPRLLAFDVSCRGCLQRIHARQDPAVEVLSDSGLHRGWAHDDCVEEIALLNLFQEEEDE